MSADLIAVATLAAFGLLWMFVNMKVGRASPAKTVTFFLMWTFLLAASFHAVRLAWEVLS